MFFEKFLYSVLFLLQSVFGSDSLKVFYFDGFRADRVKEYFLKK